MRSMQIYRNGELAGILTEEGRTSYVFRYDDAYYHDAGKAAISLNLPKKQQEYKSEYLFPFFYNMLSEGVNKRLQNKQLKIDEADSFGLLMATAQFDTIGPITVKPIEST
ncbi:MAG: HipA N-terminal domain-containing protein [Bacteroidales bacterium]|nr:HipA N-terminal domain-containing protein [Bacteroidales bacterium]